MSNDLIEVGRYNSAAEAALARNLLNDADISACIDGEAMAGWFWHLGSAIGGVKLLVGGQDAERATSILETAPTKADLDAAGFGDDSEEADDKMGEEISPELTRAFRASIMGLCFLPPLLNFYSVYLLVRHNLFRAPRNWRVGAAITANCVAISLVAWVVFMMVTPQNRPPQYFLLNGKPFPIKSETREENIPLVP